MPSRPRHQSPKAFRYVEICQTQSSASLCDLKLGKLRIDCCFLVSKMRWGKHNDKDTGVMYLDLKFHQPTDCRVAQATITMDLHEIQEPRARVVAWSDSDLEVTEFFGPQTLSGERRERQISNVIEAKPSAGFAGATAEGFGWSKTSNEVHSSRWKFTGSRFTIDSSQNESRRNRCRRYRQLVWHLEENELERQSVHRSTVHSALAFHHQSEPFYIDLNIQVKMHRWHHRVKQHLICPPRNRKAITRARIEPDDNAESDTEFAQLVRDLDRSMTEANLHPVEEVSDPRQRSKSSDEDQECDRNLNLNTPPSASLLSLAEKLTGQELPLTVTPKTNSVTSSNALSSSSTLIGSDTGSKEPAEQRDPECTSVKPVNDPKCSTALKQVEINLTPQQEVLRAALYALYQMSQAMAIMIASLIMVLNGLHSMFAQAGKVQRANEDSSVKSEKM